MNAKQVKQRNILNELLGKEPITEEEKLKRQIIRTIIKRETEFDVYPDMFETNIVKEADSIIKNNEIFINSIISDLLNDSLKVISNLYEKIDDKKEADGIKLLIQFIFSNFAKMLLRNDFYSLFRLVNVDNAKSSNNKIKGHLIYLDCKANKYFIDFFKLQMHLRPIIFSFEFAVDLLEKRNREWLEEYIKLHQEKVNNYKKDEFKEKVIAAIKTLKSEYKKLTQKTVAKELGFSRTTLIDRCKNKGFRITDLIKAYK